MASWKDNPNEFATDVIEHLRSEGNFQIDEYGGDYEEWQTECDALIDEVNATEVKPVTHAHWEIIYESSAGVTDARCSNCGFESLAYENDVHTDENCNYCPCCGAKMDEAEIIGKRLIDGFIDGIGDNAKSVGQKFINNDKDTVEHTIMGMKNEVKDV